MNQNTDKGGKMKRLIYFFIFGVFLSSCMTSARHLTEIELGDTKDICIKKIGQPESVSLKFKTDNGNDIEIWNYRLYQYEMATSLSPYFDIYSFIFLNGKLERYEKIEEGARLCSTEITWVSRY